MSYESDEAALFNVWSLEVRAYQLAQTFISYIDEDESCSTCLHCHLTIWSTLVNLLPDMDNDDRLLDWTVLSSLIAFCHKKKVDCFERLVEEVTVQKCRLGINDDVSSEVLQFLHTMITLYHYDEQNIRMARNYMQKNKVLYGEQMSKLLNHDSNLTIPEELQMKNLRTHLHPYIKAAVNVLGKPKCYKVISIMQKRSKEDERRRAVLDKIISECVVARSVSGNICEEAMMNALPQCDTVQINCNEVSSSNSIEINDNHPSLPINTLAGERWARSCKVLLIKQDYINSAKSQGSKNTSKVTKVTSKSSINGDSGRVISSQGDRKYHNLTCNDANVNQKSRGARNITTRKKPLFTKSHLLDSTIKLTSTSTRRKHTEEDNDVDFTSDKVNNISGERMIWTSDEDSNDMPFQLNGHPSIGKKVDTTIKRNTSKSKMNTKKVKFSKDEESYIIRGVGEYGVGNWREILNAYPFHKSRTNIRIKDKYRTLLKNGLIEKS